MLYLFFETLTYRVIATRIIHDFLFDILFINFFFLNATTFNLQYSVHFYSLEVSFRKHTFNSFKRKLKMYLSLDKKCFVDLIAYRLFQ